MSENEEIARRIRLRILEENAFNAGYREALRVIVDDIEKAIDHSPPRKRISAIEKLLDGYRKSYQKEQSE